MFLVLGLCSYFFLVNGYLQEVEIPVYTPPSQEVILNKYFQNKYKEIEVTSRNRKSIVTDSDKFYKAIEFMKNDLSTNITNLRREMFAKNISEIDSKKNVSSVVRSKVLHSYVETTTYAYPTATWSSHVYEKLKQNRSRYLTMKPSRFFKRKKLPSDSELSSTNILDDRVQRNDLVDKFLEQSLIKYLISTNRNFENVSVKAFSEILKNITQQKNLKTIDRKHSPYDANKELRIRFRDEVFSKKKNENKVAGGFLEKQLQRRLEKMQDEKNKDKHVVKYNQTNRVIEPVKVSDITFTTTTTVAGTEATTYEVTTISSSTEPVISTTLKVLTSTNVTEAPRKQRRWRGGDKTKNRLTRRRPKDAEELKLSVAETVYYRRRQAPLQKVATEEDTPGVIPGIPEVDYPMYNVPPETGFKCPNMNGVQRPKMMADVAARCQVFYICTGDGPASAMLCPNGTMFNENVLVCDWWYNVDC